MRGVFTWLVAAAVAALVLAGGTAASTQLPAQKHALAALAKAVESGYVDGADAAADRAEIARAARLIRGLPAARGRPIAVALGQIVGLSGRLSGPRALAVFGQLKANDDYFAKHYAPAPQTDVAGPDGVVYRYFPGRCLEFHPLASFGVLNADVAAKNVEATSTLANALVARGIHEPSGGVGWEYDFDFEGGHAPWLSGMAQAVAAQALARASALVPDETSMLLGQATAAYQAISPKLLTRVSAGPWIRLYEFSSMPVLNAQLQTVVSLQSYAQASGNTEAATLAGRLQTAAAAMLGRFDTGYWSFYSLDGRQSPVDYQQFVVSLLKKLAPADPRFASAAQRFAGYLTQPPAFKVANAGLGQVRFWLSKPSSVQLDSGAGPTRRLALGAGWHTVGWDEPARAGVYGVTAKATDWAGNSAAFSALPIVRVTTQPKKPAKTAAARATDATKAAAAGQSTFSVGVGVDDASQAPLATQVGIHLLRMGLAWPAGATAPDPGVLTALQSLPAGSSLALELFADPLPADDPGRASIAAYAASLAQQLPALHDLVLEPAPTVATAPAYAATLEAIRTAVVAAVPTVAVGASIDGAASPKAAVAALGRALAGAPVDVVAFRPAAAAAAGAWTTANVPQLTAAVGQALGSAPPVLEDGLPSSSPTDAAQAVTAAACSPTLAGVILDHLVDTPASATTAAGLFAADGTAKTGGPALAAAVAAAQRGTQVCPGIASPAAASDLEVPATLSATGPLSVTLGCVRDCLYLVTLDAGDGKPVVAARGALVGGATAAAIALPAATLSSGSYRFDVRLVSQVNPGPVTQLRSPPLDVP